MDWKSIIKRTIIQIIIILVVMLVLYFAIKIIYTQERINQPSGENTIGIIDGDTFTLASGEVIRLLCVDTPEKGETGYEEAKAFLSSSLIGQDILVEANGIDAYNRTLAWVSINNSNELILVNKEIINQGFGTLFEYNGTNCDGLKE